MKRWKDKLVLLVLLILVTAFFTVLAYHLFYRKAPAPPPVPAPTISLLATNADYASWLISNAPPRPPNPYIQYSPTAPGYWILK